MSEQQQQQRTEHDDQAQVAQSEDEQTRMDPQQAGRQAVADTEQHVAGRQRGAGADYQAPEDKRLEWLQGQREGLLKLYRAGKIDVSTAIAKAVRYDQHINSGQSSIEGAVMIAQLGLDLAQIISAEAEQARPPAQQPASAQQQQVTQQAPPIVQQAPPVVKQAVEQAVTGVPVGQVDSKPTVKEEATVLNKVRALEKRFDPAWLAAAQTALGVEATGAFTTATLRAMRQRTGNPALGASDIAKLDFLQSIHAGDPFMETEGEHARQAADPTKNTPADRTAQALGYKSYAAYHETWVPITLLGKNLNARHGGQDKAGHPHLAARLRVADAYLRKRFPGQDDKQIRKTLGWNGDGNASYMDDASSGAAHVHVMGIAIDIDPKHNPWAYNPQDTIGANWWNQMFEHASRIYGGEKITSQRLFELGKETSTEEMYAKLEETSESLKSYFALCGQDEDTRRAALTKAGYSADEIQKLLPKMGVHLKVRQNKGIETFSNISGELLIALRDAAGLAWGGTDFPGGSQEGDFMHFDCRTDSWGEKVFSIGAREAKAAKR
ncbi:MAG TPA: hypothetical protein VML75_11430 [Kofleriaceae bacterium]|nr:hypothetical protein [Kofleriaceae bacterium]